MRAISTAYRSRDEGGVSRPSISPEQMKLAMIRSLNRLTYRQYQDLLGEVPGDFTSRNRVSLDLTQLPITDCELKKMLLNQNPSGRIIARFPYANEINLSQCSRFTDAGLDILEWMPLLQKLDLRGCRQLTSSGFSRLQHVPRLESLNLSGTNVSDDDIEMIVRVCPKLQSLILIGCDRLTPAARDCLSELEDLTDLKYWPI